jgi:hypothetical protein
VESPTIFSAASAGTTFRPTSTYTTLRDVTRRSSGALSSAVAAARAAGSGGAGEAMLVELA